MLLNLELKGLPWMSFQRTDFVKITAPKLKQVIVVAVFTA